MVFEVVCSSVRSSWIFVLNSGSLSPNQGECNSLHTHRRHPHLKIALQLATDDGSYTASNKCTAHASSALHQCAARVGPGPITRSNA